MTLLPLYRFEEPTADPIPVLVDVPHAGEQEPGAIGSELAAPYPVRKRDFDLYVDQFWVDAPSKGASMMVAHNSRYVVDLNRGADDVDAGSVVGHENPVGTHRRGLLWQVTAAGEPVMTSPLASDAYARRVATYHTPYHARLTQGLSKLKEAFGHVVLVDAHSMPSVGRADHTDPGVRRADIVPGTNLGRACPPHLVRLCVDVFEGHGLSVKVDDPYKGGWITRHYGRPDEQQFALQIEVNRDVYMDERTFAINDDGLTTLRLACSAFVEALQSWRP